MAGLIPFNRRRNSLFNDTFTDFYNMVDDFFNDDFLRAKSSFKVDIQDNEKEYVIEAQLPGVNKDEIDLEFEKGRLTISVQREETVDEEKKNYVHKESRYCSMSRSVYLRDALQEGVKAKLDSGILTITVPKEKLIVNRKKIEIE
ncbi:MAG: Hsp20/alpha crystallin family protein [Tissierellia bacterium]|nr:Hsp20/alpha crystallin family protein [Tissierellia bacterium]